jgi:hypothetical protein
MTHRRYYLSGPHTSQAGTIYVLDADEEEDDRYLRHRLGAQRITRQQAIGIDRVHRHTGRGTAWCQPEGQVHQFAVQGYGDYSVLQAAIDGAADGTAALIKYYREIDAG